MKNTWITTENQAPVITGPVEIFASVNEPVVFRLVLDDPDGNNADIVIQEEMPANATYTRISDDAIEVQWTPTSLQREIFRYISEWFT